MTEVRASANLFLDKSRTLKGTNQHPVNIRICHNRKQWMTGLRIYCMEEDYNNALAAKGAITLKIKKLCDALLEKRQKAETV